MKKKREKLNLEFVDNELNISGVDLNRSQFLLPAFKVPATCQSNTTQKAKTFFSYLNLLALRSASLEAPIEAIAWNTDIDLCNPNQIFFFNLTELKI